MLRNKQLFSIHKRRKSNPRYYIYIPNFHRIRKKNRPQFLFHTNQFSPQMLRICIILIIVKPNLLPSLFQFQQCSVFLDPFESLQMILHVSWLLLFLLKIQWNKKRCHHQLHQICRQNYTRKLTVHSRISSRCFIVILKTLKFFVVFSQVK